MRKLFLVVTLLTLALTSAAQQKKTTPPPKPAATKPAPAPAASTTQSKSSPPPAATGTQTSTTPSPAPTPAPQKPAPSAAIGAQPFISGTVLSATNAPIAGATIVARAAGNLTPYSVTSAQDGSFRLPGLHSGNYSVVVTAPNYLPKTLSAIVPISGGATLNVTLSLIGFPVSGTVVCKQGACSSQVQPVAGATVQAVLTSGPGTYNTTTDTQGAFAFASIPPGIYMLKVSAPSLQAKSTRIQVTNAPLTGVQVVLFPPGQ